MEIKPCCDAVSLAWQQIPSGERYSDTLRCTGCGHIHATEVWWVPLQLRGPDACIGCGGSDRKGARCRQCGETEAETRRHHEELAALHPTGDMLEAAIAAQELGRNALAIKLSTAALHWGPDPIAARTVRIQALAAMRRVDRALDEAWEWTNQGAPQPIWSLIAELEADAGNLAGALKALESGLQMDPQDSGMWIDYAELCNEIEEYIPALDAASHALEDPHSRPRALALITQIAGDYYAARQYNDAATAARYAGTWQERHTPLAWLRAQVAANERDGDEALRWTRTVLDLEPSHAAALAAMETLQPKKKGWLGW